MSNASKKSEAWQQIVTPPRIPYNEYTDLDYMHDDPAVNIERIDFEVVSSRNGKLVKKTYTMFVVSLFGVWQIVTCLHTLVLRK